MEKRKEMEQVKVQTTEVRKTINGGFNLGKIYKDRKEDEKIKFFKLKGNVQNDLRAFARWLGRNNDFIPATEDLLKLTKNLWRISGDGNCQFLKKDQEDLVYPLTS